MNKFIPLFLCAFSIATSASAAAVRSGHYNAATGAIDLGVVYSGGCQEHQFKIELEGCSDLTFPVSCTAKLVDMTTTDFCESFVGREVSVPLESLGLSDPFYSEATLEIIGDRDFGSEDDKPTTVTVRLPAR